MLDGAGKVRITDFGLAGASGEAIRAGTPAYMAPEQLAGHEVTARSDIYSLGLVLYELFTGQRALEGKNLAELIQKREQSGIAPPTSLVKALDPQIELAVMRCLSPAAGRTASIRSGGRRRAAGRRPAGGGACRWRNAVSGHGRGRRPDRSAASGCRPRPRRQLSSLGSSRVPPSRIAFSSTRGCRCRSRSIRSTTARATSWAPLAIQPRAATRPPASPSTSTSSRRFRGRATRRTDGMNSIGGLRRS